MTSYDIVLAHPVRTAIGRFNGSLKSIPATELGATVIQDEGVHQFPAWCDDNRIPVRIERLVENQEDRIYFHFHSRGACTDLAH